MKKTIISLLVALTTTGAWAQIAVSGSGNTRTFIMPAYDVEVSTELYYKLSQSGDNSAYNTKTNVFLERTLNAKGSESKVWNSFCAPFDISAAKVTALGMTVKELTDASISGGTLTLTFGDASSITAGKPYLVQVNSALDFTADGNEFADITPDWVAEPVEFSGVVTFQPVLTPTAITKDDKTVLFVTNTGKLTWPSSAGTIKAFRAYFKLASAMSAREFVMDFGDGETTGIQLIENAPRVNENTNTYDLQGRKVAQPTQKGIYIQNGKKVVVK